MRRMRRIRRSRRKMRRGRRRRGGGRRRIGITGFLDFVHRMEL
jgi:hypothetical protein